MNPIKVSKFLSLILRHKPETVGIALDDGGWAEVAELLPAMAQHGTELSFDELVKVVETNDKQRFSFNEDRTRIRAAQGHSKQVELGYAPAVPPNRLFHGSVAKFLGSIREQGLVPGSRQQVHLSVDVETAERVGQRRGQPVVLTIDAAAMQADGHAFFVSDNGVWLTDKVPPRYITDGL